MVVLVAKGQKIRMDVIGETPSERKGKGKRGDDIRIPNFGIPVR